MLAHLRWRCVFEQHTHSTFSTGGTCRPQQAIMYQAQGLVPDKTTQSCNAGDYDYDDSEELPAGCQYMDSRSPMKPHTLNLINGSTSAVSAPAPSPIGATQSALSASSSGFLSHAVGSAMAAAGAPANPPQLTALKMSRSAPSAAAIGMAGPAQEYMAFQDGVTSGELIPGAPAPAPVRTPRNATLAAAKRAAMLQGLGEPDNTRGLVQMLCRPVPARSAPSAQPEDSHWYSRMYPGPSAWIIWAVAILNTCSTFLRCCRGSKRVAPGS